MSSNIKKLFDVRELSLSQLDQGKWSEFSVKDNDEEKIKTFNEFKNQMKNMKEGLSIQLDDGARLAKLQAYYDDLCGQEVKLEMCKFPLDLTTELKEWLLFNIAVCQGNVATSRDVSTEDGVKLLQESAGIFSYLQTTMPICKSRIGKTLPNVRLAQAQELLILKAIDDKANESDIRQLVCWCAKIYGQMDTEKFHVGLMYGNDNYYDSFNGDFWSGQVNGKRWEFSGLAKFYESLKCRNDGEIGMAIHIMEGAIKRDFKYAESKLNSKIIKKIESQAKQVLIEMKKQLGENENFTVSVPTFEMDGFPNELVFGFPNEFMIEPRREEKQLAFMRVITNPMSSNFDGLFETPALHNHTETVNYMINTELRILRGDDKCFKENPITLGDFKNIDMFKGNKLPRIIKMNAKFIHEKGGIQSLRALIDESEQSLNQICTMLCDSESQLDDEYSTDARLRRDYKTKWTLPPSKNVSEVYRKNGDAFRNFIKKAIAAENTLQEMFEKNSRGIEFLSCLGHEFSDDHSVKHAKLLNKMRFMMEYDHLQKRFDSLNARSDSIKSKLETVKSNLIKQFSDAFEQDQDTKLQVIENALKPLRQDISDLFASRQNLYAASKGLKLRCGKQDDSETFFERYFERASGFSYNNPWCNNESKEIENGICNELNEAYDCFITLNANLDESKKFYSNLNQMLDTFGKRVNNFCSVRKRDRVNLMIEFFDE